MTFLDLKNTALRFQKAISTSKVFDNFPIGSCKVTSVLFARFLVEERNYDQNLIFLVTAWDNYNYPGTHAWLKINDYHVDLTPSQFEGFDDTILISNERLWSNKFNIQYNEDRYENFVRKSYNQENYLIILNSY